MKTISLFIKMNIKRQLAYKKNLFGEFILSSSYYLIQFIFIDQVSSLSEGIGGYKKEDFHLIFLVFILLGVAISIFTHSIEEFFNKVASGRIEPYLVKPISIWVLILFGWSKPLNIIMFIFLAFFALSFSSLPMVTKDAIQWAEFIVSIICMFIINLSFFIIFNFFTFISHRKMPVDYFHEMIYELSIVPVNFFPHGLVKYFLFALPMAFSASLPVSFFLGRNDWNIGYLIISAVFFMLGTLFFYRWGIRKFNGLGG
ncbi:MULTISPECIES: ABC-2 family transporter protein [Photorhabdus]|uniref:ABC transporter permease n=2 Tax=Photorhabdus TaxID=29487 RepID=A0A329VD75_9GAMM|nr:MULTISPECIES: ABC-2 family transporter protein [Photorhabdus]MCC8463665.1 ABC-2 family transporter protein [Photorhabdus bodei]MDB6372227.1 ABC-2 family transporter protein [Photorhabdus bodei]RAW87932.1 ABC transporter permease [Photorhabdus laumondii subsp. clarkei]